MHTRLYNTWQNIRASLWFVPSILVGLALLLALGLVEADHRLAARSSPLIPVIFAGTADAARNLLSSVAGSLITVVSIAFSLTMVALQQASTQFTPRVLRNFMSDRMSQLVLGAYTGTFVYALLVLRAVRSPSEDLSAGFVPALSVTVAIALALICLGLLIYFIHHIAESLQVGVIITRIHSELVEQIDKLYPSKMGEVAVDPLLIADLTEQLDRREQTVTIRSTQTGFLRQVDEQALLDAPLAGLKWVWIRPCIGDFITQGAVLAELDRQTDRYADVVERVRTACVIDQARSIHQDAQFGIRQLVDIALKALSPGINDPTTAEYALFYLTDALGRLAERCFPSPIRQTNQSVYLWLTHPTWDDYVALAFDQIRREADDDVHVSQTLLHMLHELALRVADNSRAAAIRRQLAEMRQSVARQSYTQADKERLDELVARVEQALGTPEAGLRGRAQSG